MYKSTNILMGLALLIFTSQSRAAIGDNDTQKAVAQLGATLMKEISHRPGETILDPSGQSDVQKVINDAKATGEVAEVRVISWADREYPANEQAASAADIKVAEQRADRIKKYLSQQGISNVTTYNMAKRPNSLQDLFKTSQAKVKNKLEVSGAAPTNVSDTGFMGFKGKSSESLVLVYLK